jgi:hypothetical protein
VALILENNLKAWLQVVALLLLVRVIVASQQCWLLKYGSATSSYITAAIKMYCGLAIARQVEAAVHIWPRVLEDHHTLSWHIRQAQLCWNSCLQTMHGNAVLLCS